LPFLFIGAVTVLSLRCLALSERANELLKIVKSRNDMAYKRAARKPRICLVCILILGIIFVFSAIQLLGWRNARANSVEYEIKHPTETVQTTELYSLTNGTKLDASGKNGLFSGNFVVSSIDTYRYYYVEGSRIRQGSVPADKTYIEYITDESVSPHLEVINTWEEIVCHYNGKERVWKTAPVDTIAKAETYYVLYIPEGSIVESFELN
jgi:hypothetical protein